MQRSWCCCCLWSTYHVLSTVHESSHYGSAIITPILFFYFYFFSSCPFYSCGNWGWERHRRLSKATSLAAGGDGTGTWTVLFQSRCPEQPQMCMSTYFFSNKPTPSSHASWKTRTPKIPIPKRTKADDHTRLLPASERPSLSMRLPSRNIWGCMIHGV